MRLLLSCLLGLSVMSAAMAEEPVLEPLRIVTATGIHELRVEVARTPQQRAQGLMFRRSLPENQGMLFDFRVELPVSMWMKNTYIPLDMIFVSRAGRVTSVARKTEPLSERVISSGGPVYAVIEVNAGTAEKLGIAPGDKVEHPLFEAAR